MWYQNHQHHTESLVISMVAGPIFEDYVSFMSIISQIKPMRKSFHPSFQMKNTFLDVNLLTPNHILLSG